MGCDRGLNWCTPVEDCTLFNSGYILHLHRRIEKAKKDHNYVTRGDRTDTWPSDYLHTRYQMVNMCRKDGTHSDHTVRAHLPTITLDGSKPDTRERHFDEYLCSPL